MEARRSDTSFTSSSAEELNFTKNFQKKVDSENYWDRIKALGRVASILSVPYIQMERQTDMLDRKLIKGFYRRALNEY